MKSYRPLFLLFSEPGLDKIEGIFVGGLARVVGEGGLDGYSGEGEQANCDPVLPLRQIFEDVSLVEEQYDAGVQEHLAVGHHVEELLREVVSVGFSKK